MSRAQLKYRKYFRIVLLLICIIQINAQMEYSEVLSAATKIANLNIARNKGHDSEEKTRIIQDQIYHLMTAVLLISVGSLIEYSKNADKSILMICIFEGFTKIIMGLFLLGVIQIDTNTKIHHGQHNYDTTLTQDFLLNIKTISHALNNVIKFILIIYVTKWVDRKRYIIWIGFFYMVIGASTLIKESIKTEYGKDFDANFYLGIVGVVTGSTMLIASIFLYYYCTLDPLDSDLIINEQCMLLTSLYRLPHVDRVILKSDFRNFVATQLDDSMGKEFSLPEDQSITYDASKNSGGISIRKQIQIDEKIDKILSTRQSVSLNDLVQVKHVQRLTIMGILNIFNYDFMDIYRRNIGEEQGFFISRPDFLGGLMMIGLGILARNDYLQGRRLTVIAALFLIKVLWELLWMAVSQIPSLEDANDAGDKSGETFFKQVPTLDWIMYYGWLYLIWLYTHMLIYGGPAQICKTYLLTENKRIFAFLLFFMTATRNMAQGIYFDELIPGLSNYRFMSKRLISAAVDVVCLVIIYPMVKDELGEIWRTNYNPFSMMYGKICNVVRKASNKEPAPSKVVKRVQGAEPNFGQTRAEREEFDTFHQKGGYVQTFNDSENY